MGGGYSLAPRPPGYATAPRPPGYATAHRAVLAGDSVLLIGLPMPDRSNGRSETKYSSNQTSWKA